MTLPALDTWIVNAAPFIGLAKIGRLNLLSETGRTIYLPKTVAREIEDGSDTDAAVEALTRIATPESSIHGMVILPLTAISPRLSVFTLDAGEAAVLTEALAREDYLCII